jgi:hypothetical protein
MKVAKPRAASAPGRQEAQPLADAQLVRVDRERALAQLAEVEDRRCVAHADTG